MQDQEGDAEVDDEAGHVDERRHERRGGRRGLPEVCPALLVHEGRAADRVQVFDDARACPINVGAVLKKKSLTRKTGKGTHSFFVTDAPDRFIKVGRRFLGEKVESAVRIER